MQDCLVDFTKIKWDSPLLGLRQKVVAKDGQKVRLAEFSEGFQEKDWCTKGHAGYVLEGSFTLQLEDRVEKFRQGDTFIIPKGDEYKHKAVIGKGERVLLLLLEVI